MNPALVIMSHFAYFHPNSVRKSSQKSQNISWNNYIAISLSCNLQTESSGHPTNVVKDVGEPSDLDEM